MIVLNLTRMLPVSIKKTAKFLVSIKNYAKKELGFYEAVFLFITIFKKKSQIL